MIKQLTSCVALLLVSGCGTKYFKEIGRVPELTPVAQEALSPYANQPVSRAAAHPPAPKRYSVWTDKKAGLFTARRAMDVGDIITVNITIDDDAEFDSQSDRKRNAQKSLGIGASTGGGFSGSADGSFNSGTSFDGSGGTKRSESLNVSIAAMVFSTLPNGNLYIRGTQEILVNAEKRVLTVEGIVRPSDILPNSTISYDRLAEARVSYGGVGRITEVQQPPYGQQVLDKFSPL